jgi:hypothetical protein
LDLVAQPREQSTDFAVAALVQHHLQQRRALLATLYADIHGVDETLRQMHAAFDLRKHIRLGDAGDQDFVDLLDAVARVRQLVGQQAIIGHEDQALAGHVETAHVKHAAHPRRQQINHARPARGIARGRYDAGWLVDGKVLKPRPRQGLAVDANLLARPVNFRSKFGDNLSVDLNAAFQDELFALATAG